jgi:hypothetical protein
MSASRDDDREAIDRAFEELVAGYHLTADRPDPLPPRTKADPEPPLRLEPESPPVEPGTAWSDNHPLFGEPKPVPADLEPEDRYVPQAQPPMPRPRLPILLAWSGVAYAAMVVLLVAFGVRLPFWMGWIALGSFLGGFGTLVFHLPRSRPPDAGDGAVL